MGRPVLKRKEGAKRDKLVATRTVNWADEPRIPAEWEKVGPEARPQPRSVVYDLSSSRSLGNKALYELTVSCQVDETSLLVYSRCRGEERLSQAYGFLCHSETLPPLPLPCTSHRRTSPQVPIGIYFAVSLHSPGGWRFPFRGSAL